ncbi:hypothetical protein [Chitinophaga polysaccharea]|uniref:hypothetical protein n=1 Tax=Chitinophaga polysaccharea TaxID=1293035 RepID=UPI0011AA0FF9|nr:hypothetical protein [Chitinophaga polysaccharea]
MGQNFDQRHLGDYALAAKLLEKQGISYSLAQLEHLRSNRLEALSQPQDLPAIWLVIGYLSPLILFAPVPFTFALSFLGIFMGAFIRLTKKTLPDGSRIAAFSIKTRNHGKWMLISGIPLIIICWTLLVRIWRG